MLEGCPALWPSHLPAEEILMNLLLKSSLLPMTLLTFLISCKSRPQLNMGGSNVSSFTFDKFEAPTDGPKWENVKVTMVRTKPTAKNIDKSFGVDKFDSGRAEDIELKVEYGTYTVNIAYSDKNGKLVYESCSKEKTKDHEINQPKFQVTIKICKVAGSDTGNNTGNNTGSNDNNSEEPAGDVTLKPSASVSITPTLE